MRFQRVPKRHGFPTSAPVDLGNMAGPSGRGVMATPPGRRIKAANRITAENLSKMATRLGRCGNINSLTGDVCVTQPHDKDVEHMAVQIGGPRDGYVYATWGGTKPNTVMPKTQEVPNE